jgi:hypothetical protein
MAISPSIATRNDFDSEGEFKVYSLFNSIYGDSEEISVFGNVNYIGAGRSLHGQIDFIYLDNDIILFIEVKGTDIYYDANRNKWYKSYQKTKEVDPFKQVTDYLYDFRDNKLRQKFSGQYLDQKIAIGYGVILPETLKPKDFEKYQKGIGSSTIEYDPEITGDIDNCGKIDDFKNFIKKLKRYWQVHPQNRNKNGLDENELNQLSKYIRSDLKFEIPLPKYFEKSEDETRFYTKKQAEFVLKMISHNVGKGFIVEGGPGTGKTLIAREYIVSLSNRENKTLFVCFNKSLADFLEADIRKENPQILNFVDIISFNNLIEKKEDPNKTWDYLVIDEGQDIFSHANMALLESFLKGGYAKGQFLICLDKDNQNTYGVFEEKYFEEFRLKHASVCPLDENCRNTLGIIKSSSNFLGVKAMECMKQQTTLSKPTYWATKEDLFLKINTVVLDLLNKGVHLKMISILTEENNIPGIIAMNHKLFTTWNQQNKFVFPEDKILVMTPEDFKGMENNVIIFTGTQDYNPHETINRSLWHVAFTRAKDNLILLLNEQFKTALTSEYFKNNPI